MFCSPAGFQAFPGSGGCGLAEHKVSAFLQGVKHTQNAVNIAQLNKMYFVFLQGFKAYPQSRERGLNIQTLFCSLQRFRYIKLYQLNGMCFLPLPDVMLSQLRCIGFCRDGETVAQLASAEKQWRSFTECPLLVTTLPNIVIMSLQGQSSQ